MHIEKKVISNLNKCYSMSTLDYKGRKCFLVAAEKTDPCYLFAEDGTLLDTVWEQPGGVMTMTPVPGGSGAFLATHQFYSPNDSAKAKIVIAEPREEGGWSIRTLCDVPFVHRFGLLQRGGNTWRLLRNGPLATITGTILLVVPFLILIFYKAVGPARPSPESGRRIQRFTAWERLVHWTTAITFIILALTGIIVMFGKVTLLPLIGHDAFSWVAIISKYLHNFIGPLFILASILLFFSFLHRNFFQHWDWNWIKKGGGIVTHQHVPAGFFNAGEKLWFWGGVVVLGLVMSITGLMLNFPYFLNAGSDFGMTRYMLQWANYFHIGAGALYMAFTMGHAYIGTLGTPGAYEAMRHGTVDEEWARQHHEIWYDELKGVPNPKRPTRSHEAVTGDRVTPPSHG